MIITAVCYNSSMRYLVVDTETTGLDHTVERIIDFAAVPIIGLTPSMECYQQYFNPEKAVLPAAYNVHGISTEFLKPYPVFKEKAAEIREYMEGAVLIIHNAPFDMKFMNAEFARSGLPPLTNQVIDTLQLARQKYPGRRASLDALCLRFNISLDERASKGHGALLDAKLLTSVYLKMITDSGMDLDNQTKKTDQTESFKSNVKISISSQEQDAKDKFIETL